MKRVKVKNLMDLVKNNYSLFFYFCFLCILSIPVYADTCPADLGAFYGGDSSGVDIGEKSKVNGNSISGSGNVLQEDGTIVSGNFSLPELNPASFPGGGGNQTVNEKGSLILSGGGKWNKLEVNEKATLTLESGTYYIDELVMEGKTTLIVSGSVSLFIGSKWDGGEKVLVNSGGSTADLKVYLYPDANMQFGEKVDFNATVIAPGNNSDIVFGEKAKVTGGIFTDSHIVFGEKATVTYGEAQKEAAQDILECSSMSFDHLEIVHDAEGLTCKPEEISFKACADAACTALYTEDVTITLNNDGNSLWEGGNIKTIHSGVIETFQLKDTTVESINLSVITSTPAAANSLVCSGNDCSMQFVDAGFVFSVPNQMSCELSSMMSIQAVKKSDSGVSCAPAFTGNQLVSFTSIYVSPVNGTKKIAITPDGGAEEVNPDSNPVTLVFDNNASANFQAAYADAGQVTLTADYNGADGLSLSGSSTFVVKPWGYGLRAYYASTDLNNATTSGLPKRKAGDSFTLEFQARCQNGSVTTKYSPANAELQVNLLLPGAGVNGVLTMDGNNYISDSNWSNISASFSSGEIIDSNTKFDEVGIIEVVVRDNNYLGTSIAQQTLTIGRFYPSYFTVSNNTAIISDACSSAFTYMGQAFDFLIPPVVTVVAKGVDNNTLFNYSDTGGVDFWKLSAPTALQRSYTDVSGSAAINNSNNLSEDELNPIGSALLGEIDNGYDGSGSITISGDYLKYSRVKSTPFNAVFDLTFLAAGLTDSDGVCYKASDSGSCLDFSISIVSATEQRYGRLLVNNAYGPEQLPLSGIRVSTEYYDGSGFTLNTIDNCTTYDSASGIDWTVAGYSGLAYGDIESTGSGTLSNGIGMFTIHKTADITLGPGKTGYVDYDFVTDNWLKFDWQGAGDADPRSRASFGVYSRSRRLIYSREIY
ncbi:MAG: hypothetical protein QNL62_18590 [Gammaproteobacteria bacterium]|nr:hypothetical protein [Gammaproteobacteria bacterium]